MSHWYNEVSPGDSVIPDPYWNATERKPHHLLPETQVLDVRKAQSQSGLLLKVKTMNGCERWLDAGWFTGKSPKKNATFPKIA